MVSRAELDRYLAALEVDRSRLDGLFALLGGGVDIGARATMPGHVTGSGVVTDGERLLVIHHVRLDRWLQPGGHLEPGETPLAAAMRETAEEAGIEVAPDPWHLRSGLPVDVDAHVIPASAKHGEPEHTHFDFRYVLHAAPGAASAPQLAEVAEIRWVTSKEARGLDLPQDLWRALRRAAELGLLPAGFAG